MCGERGTWAFVLEETVRLLRQLGSSVEPACGAACICCEQLPFFKGSHGPGS